MVLKRKTIYSFYQRIDSVADVHETPEQNGTDSETDEAARWLAEQLEEEENERIAEEIPRQSPSKVQLGKCPCVATGKTKALNNKIKENTFDPHEN
jgi:hypothetical protein